MQRFRSIKRSWHGVRYVWLGRRALAFGQSKINLHSADAPLALTRTIRSRLGRLVLRYHGVAQSVMDHLRKCGINIEEGQFLALVLLLDSVRLLSRPDGTS